MMLGRNSRFAATRGMGILLTLAVATASALVPLGAAALGVGGAFATMAVVAGAGLLAFGLMVKQQITNVHNMREAGMKLSGTMKSYLRVEEKFLDAAGKFSKDTRNATLRPLIPILSGAATAIKRCIPLFRALSTEIQVAGNALGRWLKGEGFKRFINVMRTAMLPIMRNLIAASRHFLGALGHGFRAALPSAIAMSAAIRRGAHALRQWAAGGGFSRFISYVKQNAPQIKEFFKTLWDALTNVGAAMKGLGPASLGLATALLKIVAALPVPVLQAAIIIFTAWRAAMLANAIYTGIWAAAQWALNSALFASPITWIVLAIVALIAIIVLIATKTTWFQTAWKYTWNAVKAAFSFVWNGIKLVATSIWNFLITKWRWVIAFFGPIGWLILLFTRWRTVWNAVKAVASAVWGWLKAAGRAVWRVLVAVWNAIRSGVAAAWRGTWNIVRAVARTVWGWIRTAARAVGRAVVAAWRWLRSAVPAAWRATWSFVKRVGAAVWGWIRGAGRAVARAVVAAWRWLRSAVPAAWRATWNFVKRIASNVWGWIRGAARAVGRAVIAAWRWVKSAVPAAWRATWSFVKRIASNVWGWIRSAARAVGRAVLAAWNWIKRAVPAAWRATWNFVKRIASGAWNWIVARARGLWNGLKGVFRTIWIYMKVGWHKASGWAKSIVGGVVNWLKDRWNGFINFFKGLPGRIGSIASRMFDGLKSAFQKVIDWVKDKWKQFTDIFKGGGGGGGLMGKIGGGVKKLLGFASGGMVSGPGGGKADKIPAMLSNGEFVVNAKSTKKYQDMLAAMNQNKFAKGGLVGSAGGGGKKKAPASGTAPAPAGAQAAAPQAPAGGTELEADTGQYVAQMGEAAEAAAMIPASETTMVQVLGLPVAMAGLTAYRAKATTTFMAMKASNASFSTSFQSKTSALTKSQTASWSAWRAGMVARTASTYTNMRTRSSAFAGNQAARVQNIRKNNLATWQGWRTGMAARTANAYTSMRGQSSKFAANQSARIGNVRKANLGTWQSWRTGMAARTANAYTSIRGQSARFQANQSARVGNARKSNLNTWQSWRNGMAARTSNAYASIRGQSARFQSNQSARVANARKSNLNTWSSWGSGMRARTNSTFSAMRAAGARFGATQSARIAATRRNNLAAWSSWGTGMRQRTNSTFSSIRNATNSFGKATVSKFDQIQKAVGAAWKRVQPKLKAPISYLIHTVINGGAVKAMNTIVSELGGSEKVKAIKVAGFASGGYTGNGGKYAPKGVVHGGEYVLKKSATQKIPRGVLNHMNRTGEVPGYSGGGKIPGYAEGGLVKGEILKAAGVSGGGGDNIDAMLAMMDKLSDPKGIEKIWDGVAKLIKNKLIMPTNKSGGPGMKPIAINGLEFMKKAAVAWLEQNLMMGGGNGLVPFRPWKEGDGRRVRYRGHSFNYRTMLMIKKAEKLAGQAASITQGSFSSSVGASAGTHSGGGAIDINQTSNKWIRAMRGAGFAAWARGKKWGSPKFPNHTHGIAVGDKQLSPEARAQVRSFMKGRDGLAGNGPDPHADLFGGGMGGFGNIGGSGVRRWKSLALRALKEAGISTNQIGRFLALMNAESGGNPRAINKTDSNAKKGIASRGLMQVIPPTFNAYAGKYKKLGIYHPFANMYAAARYIKARYGGRVPGSPYANGGIAKPGIAQVGERGPELINIGSTSRIHSNRDSQGLLGEGGNTYNITVNFDGNALATTDDVKNAVLAAIEQADREGRMKKYNNNAFASSLRQSYGGGVGRRI